MTLTEELNWRGFLNQTTFADNGTKELDNSSMEFYWGVDPSSDSMTIGNLAAAMLVMHFMRHGHRATLLVGGATGLIGDPDGKKQERDLLSFEEIQANKVKIVSQYKNLFQGQDFNLVDNYDWFKNMNYLAFLRDIGKHVSVGQMLGREFVRSRIGDEGSGISYAEFSYVLIQAYDYLRLFEDKGVTLQLCGSDQWGNSIAGVDLIRRKTGKEAHVYSTPLVVNKQTGQKFGKSEDGAIWLDKEKTTPTQFYQFWINIDDESVEDYLKIFSLLNKEDIESTVKAHNENPGARIGQQKLAEAVTSIVHGKELTDRAQSITQILIGKSTLADISDSAVLEDLRKEIAHVNTSDSAELAQVLVDCGLASSKTEARQFIAGNAISINNVKVNKDNLEASDFINGKLLLRRGKAFKDSALVEL